MSKSKTNQTLKFDSFREYAEKYLKKSKDAGIGIAFVSEDEILFAEGIGYRDLDKKLPLTSDTIFPIASHTKSFTATGLAMLVDEGLIDWNSPIKKFVPEFKLKDPYITENVTLTDLLSHTTGFPHHQFLFMNSEWTYKQVLKRIPYLDFAFDFRTRHKYANINFMIATKLVEELSGKDYFKFMQARVFSPLGMKNTNFSIKDVKKTDNFTKGYNNSPDGLIETEYIELKDISAGAGGINSTLKDMSKWIQFLINDGKVKDKQLVSEKSLQIMRTMQKLDNNPFTSIIPGKNYVQDYGFALGWWSLVYRGLKMHQHYGTGPGIIFNGGFSPDAKVGYALFSNTSGSNLPFVFNFYLADLIQGLEPIDWCEKIFATEEEPEQSPKPKGSPKKELPLKNTKPSRNLEEFIGTYTHPGYGQLEFFIKDEQLGTRYGKGSNLKTEHYHFDTFTIHATTLGEFAVPKLVTFRDNFEGEITHLEIDAEPLVKPAIFTKIKQ